MNIQPGDIFLSKCHANEGSSKIKGLRPVVVVRSVENSTLVHVIPLTTNQKRRISRIHVKIEGHGLKKPSIALIEQTRLIDKKLLGKQIGTIANTKQMSNIIYRLICYFNPNIA